MQHELGTPGRPGGEQHPLGGLRAAPLDCGGCELRPRDYAERGAEIGPRAAVIAHPRIGLRILHHRGQMLRCDIRRTEHHAPRDAIELDQYESGGELILREEQHAPVAQLLEAAAQARRVAEVSEGDAVADALQPTARWPGVYRLPERAPVTWQSVRTT